MLQAVKIFLTEIKMRNETKLNSKFFNILLYLMILYDMIMSLLLHTFCRISLGLSTCSLFAELIFLTFNLFSNIKFFPFCGFPATFADDTFDCVLSTALLRFETPTDFLVTTEATLSF